MLMPVFTDSLPQLEIFVCSTENIVLTSLLVDSWDIEEVGGVWIGLTDAGQKGVYNWSDGSPVDYSSWLYGQPDERYQSGSCVQATLRPGRMNWLFWQDVDCSPRLPYACAKLPGKLTLSHDDQFLLHHMMKQFSTVLPSVPVPLIKDIKLYYQGAS